MAVVAAALAVSVTARTTDFQRSMKRIGKRVKRFRSTVNRAGIAGAKFGAVLGTAAAVGIALLIRRQAEAIDVTAKLAARIGATTETITGLQHAAELTGAGAQVMNKAFDFLAKSLGEAESGIGEAKQAMDKLGLSVESLLKQTPGEKFSTIAEAVSNLATQEEKAFVATKLFGRAGIQLVNILDLGAGGIAEMRAEAESLGLTFSRVDASKVEESNDAITKLKGVFAGIGNTLAIKVAPFITKFVGGLVNSIKEAGGMKVIVADAFTKIGQSIGTVLDFVQDLRIGWAALQGGAIDMAAGITSAFIGVADSIAAVANLIPGVNLVVADGLMNFAESLSAARMEQQALIREIATGTSVRARIQGFVSDVEGGANTRAISATGGGLTEQTGVAMLDQMRQQTQLLGT